MTNTAISIEKIDFTPPFISEKSTTFGPLSKADLHQFKLNLHNIGLEGQQQLLELERMKIVKVRDHYLDIEYDAIFTKKQESFQVTTSKSFVYHIEQLDIPPSYTKIRINNITFDVLKTKTDTNDNNKLGLSGIIQATESDLYKIIDLEKNDTVDVYRVDVDEEPLKMKFGGKLFWSKFIDGDKTYYKKIYRLFEVDQDDSHKPYDLASHVIQTNAIRLLLNQVEMFDNMLNVLSSDQSLEQATKDKLQEIKLTHNNESLRKWCINNLQEIDNVEDYL